MRVLVVEDESAIADFIRRGLIAAGYAVDLAADGDEAVEWTRSAPYDLIVLDRMLPGQDGLTLCRDLRNRGMRAPILMLTARDAVDDRVAGLDAGADDYLTKPFAFTELLARLRALLRREPLSSDAVLRVADLTLDTVSRTIQRDGVPITLTYTEFSLLEYLMRRATQVVTRTMIADHIWDYEFDNVTNAIDVHISALRRKIDDRFAPKLIHTVRSVGYRLGVDP